jgi:hypothetical protein
VQPAPVWLGYATWKGSDQATIRYSNTTKTIMTHMKTNHITCKTTDTIGNLATDGASSDTPSPQDIERNGTPLDHPRYKANPIYLILECYIEDTIGHLPEIKSKTLQDMNLQKVFKTKASDWKAVIRETLRLSNNIDIAILDLWYLNREQFEDDNGKPNSYLFSQVFTDDYMADGSQVDVWPPGALDDAKERIRRAKDKYKEEETARLAPFGTRPHRLILHLS